MRKKISSVCNFFNGPFKNYIFFSLYLLSRPKNILLIFKGVYLPQYFQYEWISKFQINTFIDIGAHDGTVSQVINYISPNTTIFAFEPIPQKKRLIKSKINSDKFTVETMALSNHTGSQNFYEYDYQTASSFLKSDPKNIIYTGNIAKSYFVKVNTLDRYFEKKKLKKPIFVKIDTQGMEHLIIKGGQKLLKQSSLVIIETSFVKIYKNQCLFDDIYSELIKMGFIYKGDMLDSNFYPFFGPDAQENSIFIREKDIENTRAKD